MDPRPKSVVATADDDEIEAAVGTRFKADRDEARSPTGSASAAMAAAQPLGSAGGEASAEDRGIEARLARLDEWQLVREGRVLLRRYATVTMRASLAFAAFVTEVAAGSAVEPEIVVGLSQVQVRLLAPPGRSIGELEVAFAEAIDFIRP